MTEPHTPDKTFTFDYVLVGGGLQSGLLVLAIRHYQPEASILLLEKNETLGGNHTWSFHSGDLEGSVAKWVRPIIESWWDDYEVRISGFERRISIGYASTSSRHFAMVVSHALTSESSSQLLVSTKVQSLSAQQVTTEDGRVFGGKLVIDNRGPGVRQQEQILGGFQKFWGFEIELDEDWPIDCPIIMDDAVDQTDGFRFIYTLPFTPRRVLVEDTRFSNTPTLDRSSCLELVEDYLSSLAIKSWRIVREEHGILPMPISQGCKPTVTHDPETPLAGGYAGGWFHAATGYSFPMAAAFADTVARAQIQHVRSATHELAGHHLTRNRFARFLNRLLFKLVKPTTRFQIFRRFYRVLSEQSISRFYGHRFNLLDATRIVVGIPPRGLRPILFVRSFFETAPVDPLSATRTCSSTTDDPRLLKQVTR